MCGLLIVVASLVAEHGLQGKWVSVAAAHGLRQFWHMDLLTLWHVGYYKPMSPALVGRYFLPLREAPNPMF